MAGQKQNLKTESFEETTIQTLIGVNNILTKNLIQICMKFKLSPAKLSILKLVNSYGQDTGVSQTVISKYLTVTEANITALIVRMIKGKLIIRRRNPKDKREKLIMLTPKGEELLKKGWPVYIKSIKGFLKSLKNTELETFFRLLVKLFKFHKI